MGDGLIEPRDVLEVEDDDLRGLVVGQRGGQRFKDGGRGADVELRIGDLERALEYTVDPLDRYQEFTKTTEFASTASWRST